MKRSKCVTDEEGQADLRQVDRADLLKMDRADLPQVDRADLLKTGGADLLRMDGADLPAFWVVHRAVAAGVAVRRLIQ